MIDMIKPPADRQFPLLNMLYAGCLLFAIAGVYLYFSESNVDVRRSPKLTGRVERAYLTKQTMGSGRHSSIVTVFAFKLDQSPDTLGVYRSLGVYTDLRDALNVGDEVTVYYKPAPRSAIDLDVFQIEKGNAIILNYETYRHHYIVQSYEFGGAAVVLLFVALIVVQVRKSRVSE